MIAISVSFSVRPTLRKISLRQNRHAAFPLLRRDDRDRPRTPNTRELCSVAEQRPSSSVAYPNTLRVLSSVLRSASVWIAISIRSGTKRLGSSRCTQDYDVQQLGESLLDGNRPDRQPLLADARSRGLTPSPCPTSCAAEWVHLWIEDRTRSTAATGRELSPSLSEFTQRLGRGAVQRQSILLGGRHIGRVERHAIPSGRADVILWFYTLHRGAC